MPTLSSRLAWSLPLAIAALVTACESPASSDESAAEALSPATAGLAGGVAGAGRLNSPDAGEGVSREAGRAGGLETAEEGEGLVAAGAPITAPLETWTWVDFPEAQCADGSSTGIGVNLTTRSKRVVLFFEGGGGCWDYATCYELGFAANLDGYDGKDFTNRRPYNNVPLLNRDNAANPLADASYVYIPYCTGDVHGGNKVSDLTGHGQTKTTYFVGSRNTAAYLSRIVPTFPGASRVWVTGWSAGGFGAALNWDQAQKAFGGVRVDVIDDSGPPIKPNQGRYDTWVSAWNMQLPPDCATCTTDLNAIIDYYAAKYDGTHRFGLLSYTQDSTISTYFSISRKRFETELNQAATNQFDTRKSMKYFFVTGSSHTLLGSNVVSADGIQLYDWLDELVNDDPNWQSTRP